MADIKYLLKFGKREHLESLVNGNIYCSNAITFWGIEDKLKIKGQGDILEAGTRMFAQKMIMQHPETKEVIAKCGKANGLVSAFCTLWRSQMRFRAVALRSITAARF